MAQLLIDTTPGAGDNGKAGGDKINSNFTDLYANKADSTDVALKADNSSVVHNTTDETVAGIKTFTSSPIVPTPASGTDVANKAYVDASSGSGVPTSRTVNGHALSADVVVTATDVGLGNANNTSDANKPLSTADIAALALKAEKLVLTAIKTAAYTAVANDYVIVDSTSGVFAITLPTAPTNGTTIGVQKKAGAPNNTTVIPGGSDTIGSTTVLNMTVNGSTVVLQYNTATTNWSFVGSYLPDVYPAIPVTTSRDFTAGDILNTIEVASGVILTLNADPAANFETNIEAPATGSIQVKWVTGKTVNGIAGPSGKALSRNGSYPYIQLLKRSAGDYNLVGGSVPLFGSFPTLNTARLAGRGQLQFIGDSLTMGRAAGTGTNQTDGAFPLSFPAKAAQRFIALGYPAVNQSFFGSAVTTDIADYVLYNPRVTAGVWTVGTGTAYSIGGFQFTSTAAGAPLIYSPANACDTLDLYWPQSTTFGSMTYTIDAGSPVTINENNATQLLNKTTISLGSVGTHTISFNWLSGGAVFIAGMEAYTAATNGITVYNTGARGWSTNNWTGTTPPWRPKPAITKFAPHASVICLGVNDFRLGGAGTTGGTFVTQYQAIIDVAKVSGEVGLLIPFEYGPTEEGTVTQATWWNYIRNFASSQNLPLLDLPATIGSYATLNAAGQMAADHIHPLATPMANAGTAIANWMATGFPA